MNGDRSRVLGWDDFVAALPIDRDGATPERALRTSEGSVFSDLGLLQVLVFLEAEAGDEIPLDLFDTIDTLGELYDWYLVIATRR